MLQFKVMSRGFILLESLAFQLKIGEDFRVRVRARVVVLAMRNVQ
jgi:hypothetical protein